MTWQHFWLQVRVPDVALIRFAVYDALGASGVPVAFSVLPLMCMRPGYRYVRLRRLHENDTAMDCSLFIQVCNV
jgi:hypothetical protein